jgi:DNA repair protein RecO (recombination protein O)
MRPARSYAIEAIVLKHMDLGEADRILTLFTPQKGKYQALAKGARKPGSRKAGHLELLARSQLQLGMGRTFDIITQAQHLENFSHLRTDLSLMTCGFYLAEITDRFLTEQTEHMDVYQLLLETLRALARPDEQENEQQKQTRLQILLRYYELKLLAQIGYEPTLIRCAHCERELLPEENGFAASLGGALCPHCSHLWNQALSLNGLKLLRILQRSPQWTRVPAFQPSVAILQETERAMHALIRYHLERDLKSWDFLNSFVMPTH